MSFSDELMWTYYQLLTDVDGKERRAMHPMEAKKQLAEMIVSRFHGEDQGRKAREEFERVFSQHRLPEDIPAKTLEAEDGGLGIARALTRAGLPQSNGEAIRLIKQGALSVNGEKITDKDYHLLPGGPYLIRLGKRRFLRLAVSSP
jgi:tyrosyl-tRNA synthetase